MPVDRNSPQPLHAQVAAVLRSEIRDHAMAPGAALPSEAMLRERFGVARSVVRQALAALVAEGLVRREQGRAPVVAPPQEHRRLVQRATGLFDQFSRSGLTLRTRVVHLTSANPPPQVAEYLGTTDTVRLERVRSVGSEPVAYVRTWLPAARVAGLTEEMLTDVSLHDVLETTLGSRPVSGRRQVRAVPADARLAKALALPEGAPLLLLEGGGADRQGRPLEWFATWHRADRVAFEVELSEQDEQLRLTPTSDLLSAATPPNSVATREGPSFDRARELMEQLRHELDSLAGGPSAS
ncbi:GntR family transcriptional regulator [Actinoalloteichus hymeniacidonis]|uniref:Transcriptional regulator n=1 Tax=Actinoalloteichus hymeniacidonis TaxID=340345 RepID=A0AAC9HQ58_9PSEU|nr:GntR family transcriptional regulator [Actinoalloteichus hymeniacidonis]AOS62540.1 transcriptional regulator [Actinoalloteichus hymeniacidonis]MBB5909429.1 GntR family transcriptional regulator [Actinoalloteichus hymeniacidonis]